MIDLSVTHCSLIWPPYMSGLFRNEWYSLYPVLILDKSWSEILRYTVGNVPNTYVMAQCRHFPAYLKTEN